MRKILIIVSLIFITISIFGCYLFINRNYENNSMAYKFGCYIGTHYSEGFSHSKFKLVNKGMTKQLVERSIGAPLYFIKMDSSHTKRDNAVFYSKYSEERVFTFNYVSFWEFCGVYYDKDTLVVYTEQYFEDEFD